MVPAGVGAGSGGVLLQPIEGACSHNGVRYGLSLPRTTQACAIVGAYHACDWVLDNAEELRVSVGKNTIPSMMRKVAGSGADLPKVERLYRLEKSRRGSSTNAGRGTWNCLYFLLDNWTVGQNQRERVGSPSGWKSWY